MIGEEGNLKVACHDGVYAGTCPTTETDISDTESLAFDLIREAQSLFMPEIKNISVLPYQYGQNFHTLLNNHTIDIYPLGKSYSASRGEEAHFTNPFVLEQGVSFFVNPRPRNTPIPFLTPFGYDVWALGLLTYLAVVMTMCLVTSEKNPFVNAINVSLHSNIWSKWKTGASKLLIVVWSASSLIGLVLYGCIFIKKLSPLSNEIFNDISTLADAVRSKSYRLYAYRNDGDYKEILQNPKPQFTKLRQALRDNPPKFFPDFIPMAEAVSRDPGSVLVTSLASAAPYFMRDPCAYKVQLAGPDDFRLKHKSLGLLRKGSNISDFEQYLRDRLSRASTHFLEFGIAEKFKRRYKIDLTSLERLMNSCSVAPQRPMKVFQVFGLLIFLASSFALSSLVQILELIVCSNTTIYRQYCATGESQVVFDE